MIELNTDVYIPILDDRITERDVKESIKDSKKGGYDFKLSVLHILVDNMLPSLVLLLNCMFYVAYPVKLTRLLLITIPKLEN